MKRLETYITKGFQAEMDPLFAINLIRIVNALFGDFPYDMFVFEPNETGYLQIRLAGYSFEDNRLDEDTVIATTKIKLDSTFWWKVDDYGDRYICTFLFPHEY